MNYFGAFDISASGMDLQRMRLDVSSINLANAYTTRAADGSLFKPLQVIATSKTNPAFQQLLDGFGNVSGTEVLGGATGEVREMASEPRMVFDPGNPQADAKGFVAYPNVNTVSEMINLISTTRAYEANVRALNAAKTMALKALEIGG